MNPVRRAACYLTAILFLCCAAQWELLWIGGLLEDRTLSEEGVSGEYGRCRDAIESVWEELACFPVPESDTNPLALVTFENTWLAERNYGGKRSHEGCDVMASIEESGYYPVVSMTEGIVEQVGWLEKGGYRIGIRSGGGNYYYYAHLASYAKEWQSGDPVQAGTLLGYMGDTGYGPEGTTGQFPVHLHLGVYIPLGADREIAVNPYWMLKYLENRKLSYSY